MDVIESISQNRMLMIPVAAWAMAQIIKILLHVWKEKSFNPERIFGAGGMPSSHSAFVTSLAIAVGQLEGYRTAYFAIAASFALVVMYDACGVRRAAGQQAVILNQFFSGEAKLKELIGHSPFEVLMGAILGICAGFLLA